MKDIFRNHHKTVTMFYWCTRHNFSWLLATTMSKSEECASKYLIAWCILVNETPHSITRHHTQSYLWAPNCSHSTLILVCCSTSPSWRVQRLSHGDWPSPQLIFAGLECKEGPQCASVCCVSILRILFPLTTAMLHVVKGGHVLLFWSVAETRLAAIANTAGCTKKTQQRHQFFLIRKILEEGLKIWHKIPHVAHLVYLSKPQI